MRTFLTELGCTIRVKLLTIKKLIKKRETYHEDV